MGWNPKGWNWGKIWTGVKIAIGVAVTAQEHGLIKVKELPQVVDVINEIDKHVQ